MSDKAKILLQTLKKIPLLTGLAPSQIQTVIAICSPRRYAAGEGICEAGSAPDELFILLSGELGVVTDDGTVVAKLSPVTTVGEMGIITRQERKASVVAQAPSNVLIITRHAFEALLRSDASVQARVYKNIVDILAHKIVEDNVRLRDHLKDRAQNEAKLTESRRRAEIAQQMLVKATGQSAEEVASRIDEQLLSTRPQRVLVVDDEEEIRTLVKRALDGFDVSMAPDAEQALELLEADLPDMVVTDIKLPGMDGLQLREQIRERWPDLPVIGISGFVTLDDVQEVGFSEFLTKPMELKQLREAVAAAMPVDAAQQRVSAN